MGREMLGASWMLAILYYLTWVIAKQMFILQIFIKLYIYVLCTFLYVHCISQYTILKRIFKKENKMKQSLSESLGEEYISNFRFLQILEIQLKWYIFYNSPRSLAVITIVKHIKISAGKHLNNHTRKHMKEL